MDEIIERELTFIRRVFDLEELLEFQIKNDIQIIRGDDYQYQCYINGQCYANDLTPIGSLMTGIIQYNKQFD